MSLLFGIDNAGIMGAPAPDILLFLLLFCGFADGFRFRAVVILVLLFLVRLSLPPRGLNYQIFVLGQSDVGSVYDLILPFCPPLVVKGRKKEKARLFLRQQQKNPDAKKSQKQEKRDKKRDKKE